MSEINRFTPAYDRARASIKSYKFSLDWHKILTDEIIIKTLFGSADGPNSTYAANLDKFRKRLNINKAKTEGDIILAMADVKGTSPLTNTQVDAIATLKLMRHLYLLGSRGAQHVWIYAQPYSFHKWVYDEITGCTPVSAKEKLDKIDEVFPGTIRNHMLSGVQQALSWSQKGVAKLGSPDEVTKDIINRWFFNGKVSTEQMATASSKLLAGFKKLVTLCNSNQLIFSDEPKDRMTGGSISGQLNYKSNWEDYAFVDGGVGERLDVVYIQNATLKKWASADESWMATLAIIHELSHRLISTKDAVYDFTGLKPSSKLTHDHAIVNADTWAYFITDLNGQLPANKRTSVYREPAALRAQYLNSL